MVHQLPKLEYKYDALEPYIDAKTMEIHYTKHHQTYVDKLNKAIEGTKYENKEVIELLKDLNSIPENIRTAVRNHGGGHFNHTFFWKILKKDTKLKGEISKEINKSFGSFDEFKKQFTDTSLSVFGSGWAWLVLNKGKLEIMKTKNQGNPLSEGKIPILGIDVWEHSYYILYQNRRQEYIEAFFNVINWDQVNESLIKAKK